MAHIRGSAYEESNRMSGNQEPEMYPMRGRGYYGDRSQNYIVPGQNREPGYDMPPMTNRAMYLPRAHLMSPPQERAEDKTYRHQGDNYNAGEGQGYGVPPMKSSDPNVYSTITLQPEAYAGQITKSDQRITPTGYGVPPMEGSDPNVYSAITLQPEAYAGQMPTSDQGITPTTASGLNTSDLVTLWQSKGWLIFKRVISIVFIIADIVLAWEQVIEMDKVSYSFLSYVINFPELGCPPVQPVVVTYKVIMSFCTLFTITQIINIIGETMYDMTEGQHGFQIIHGFNEVIIKTIIKDIPQFLLMFVAVFLKCACASKADRWVLFIAVTIISYLSCIIRQMTCKQEVRNWCTCECYTKCQNPLEECGCACPYLCCYLPVRTKLFKPCVPLSFFELLGCCVKGGFKLDFIPRLKDPVFAIHLWHRLYEYVFVFVILNIIITIIRCDLPFDMKVCQFPIFRCS